jgi:hypothetical protein
VGASTLFATSLPHRCNHKRERERCIICHHKSICFCNFVGFHKSSASKKRYVPTTCITYPFISGNTSANFFQAEKMYSIIFSTISKIIATVLSDEQSSTKITSFHRFDFEPIESLLR